MRRLLLTGDWHLSDNPRDAYRFGAVDRIRELLAKHKVDDLFILGDLTDYPDGHSAAFTNRIVELLAKLASGCCVHIIRGNHDASDPAIPFFRFINQIEGCRFLTEVTAWQQQEFRVLLVPYGCWPDQLPDGYHAVMTHHTFTGAVAEHGTRLNGLRLPLSFVPVFSGDVHVPQRQGSVTYVGAPTLIRFGDAYKPRVLLVDLVPDSQPVVRAIPIGGPTKRLVEVRARVDGVLYWKEDLLAVEPDDIVKVRVSFPNGPPPLSHLRADIAKAIEQRHAKLFAIEVAGDRRNTNTPRTPVSRSDTDLVRQYGAAHNLQPAVIKAGLGIVEKV